jgi:hypothetical protein
MFPTFPRNVIQTDLGQTGSIESTIERILTGQLVAVSFYGSDDDQLICQPPTPVAPQASTTAPKKEIKTIDLDRPVNEPAKKWESDPDLRSMNLQQRKAYMVQQARQ